MSRFPQTSGKQLVAALGRAGFQTSRVRGSHHFLKHPDGRATCIPVHAGENIGPGLLARIMRDCDLTRDQLIDFLRS